MLVKITNGKQIFRVALSLLLLYLFVINLISNGQGVLPYVLCGNLYREERIFMIPKKIHYCWFGGNPLPELAQKCILSWKKYCPDYEIIEWNESNFDINCCDYVREAYEAKKWAFVSDVARLYALVNYGGIYMDTDVEVLRSLDDLLTYDAVSGFEAKDRIPTGLMACREGQSLFVELLNEYDAIHFLRKDGTYDTTTNVTRITNTCLKYGLQLNNTLQTVNGFTLLPCDYLCPKDCETHALTITKNTYVIHHFDGSWLSEVDRVTVEMSRRYRKVLPKSAANLLGRFVAKKRINGLKVAIKDTLRWLKKRNE